MPSNDETKGLYKKGLLPKEWNGKKVKKNRLADLLLDPEFKSIATSALHHSNVNKSGDGLLKNKYEDGGVALSDDERRRLIEMQELRAISPEEEGRDFGYRQREIDDRTLREQERMAGVPDQFQPANRYADGGITEAPVEPTQLDTYQSMMQDLQNRESKYQEDKKQAEYADIASGLAKSFGEYGVSRAAAKAQSASDLRLRAPEVDIASTNLAAQVKRPDVGEYAQKLKLMKDFKALRPKVTAPKDFTLGEGQIRYDAKGKVIASGPERVGKDTPVRTKVIKTIVNGVPITKLINSATGETIQEFEAAPAKPGQIPLSMDPNSKESKAAQEKLKGIGFNMAPEDIGKLNQNDIEGNFGAFIRKTTRKIEQVREKRLTEKQAWQVAEKDEVSDKQLDSIQALDDITKMVERIVELKKKVKLSKGLIGPKVRQAATQIGAEYLGIEPDEDYVRLQALVEKQLSDYIKSASGLTVSDSEATRLSRAIPSMSMPDRQFNSVMKEFQTTLSDVRNTRFKNLKGYQGKILPTETVINREGLIKRVKTKYPTWPRDKVIRYLKEKKRW